MTIVPTLLARVARVSSSPSEARQRVIHAYREWQRAAPEICSTYLLDIPISAVRSKIRQEFERHRYVKQLPVVDVLLLQSQKEYQETMNYWKQKSHLLKYFRAEEDPSAKVHADFMQNFLEGRN